MKPAPTGLSIDVRTKMATESGLPEKNSKRSNRPILVPGRPSSYTDDGSTSCSDNCVESPRSVPSRSSATSFNALLGSDLTSKREATILKRYNIDPVKEGRNAYGTDSRDVGTPDAWITGRHPNMRRLTGLHPFNCEPPVDLLMKSGFITTSALHYTRNHGPVPKLSWESHRLQLFGDLIEATEYSMDDIVDNFEHETVVITMCCAGNRRKEENMVSKTVGFSWNTTAHGTSAWTGVRLREVLLDAGLDWDDEAYDSGDWFVWMLGSDEMPKGSYGTCVPLGHVMNEANDVLLAFKHNGNILPPDRGYPLRMIIPGWIGGRMVKWLKRIEVRRREPDFYYHYFDNRILPPGVDKQKADNEDWWKKSDYLFNTLNINSAVTSPMHGEEAVLSQSFVEFKGYAYTGGGSRITRVELTTNHKTWQLCTLDRQEKPNRFGMYWCWCFWTIRISTAELKNSKSIGVRAWDATNNTQAENITWNLMGMGNNCVFKVKLERSISPNGEPTIRFIHPTQGAGLQNEGWMQPAPKPPASDEQKKLRSELEELSWQEIQKHNSKSDVWVVVDGCVYDCTSFLSSHPGGASSIYLNGGVDVTEDFYAIHSKEAVKMLDDFLIGKVPEGSAPDANVPTTSEVEQLRLLHPQRWTTFFVRTKKKVGKSSVMLHFTPSQEDATDDALDNLALRKTTNLRLGLPVGHHILVRNTSGAIRPYTPIISAQESAEDFTLLVKIYPNGKLSQYIGNLGIGDALDVKGPFGEISYVAPGTLRLEDETMSLPSLGFICGGSGITPAYRIIDEVLRNKNDQTEVYLLYANSCCEDILLKTSLDKLEKKYKNFHLKYTVSNLESVEEEKLWSGSVGRITEQMVAEFLPSGEAKDCFVGLCGPPAMLEKAAIPFLQKHGYETSMYKCF